MKHFRLITVLALSASFVACQKQQTDEERKAEVDRQVQERLAAERQQQQAQDLAQREASVSEREQALNTPQTTATVAPAVETSASTSTNAAASRENAPTTYDAANGAEGSYSIFYTKLEPYGDWIETGDYGYVYRPRESENARWRPYTNGRWVYTDAGWTWVSEEPFGWATYHYGRWTRLRGVGWVWVPGNEWAPAWVSWRKGGQYVGWAPLPPEARFDRASGIHNWSDNYYDIGPDQYVFVPATDIGDERVERVVVPEQQNVTIVSQTTNVTNITYNNTVIVNQGPNFDELRGQSRRPIQRLRLERETGAPGNNARAVVRGEVVAIPAPVIAPARAPERPRMVKQTIKQTEVDRGWSAVGNQREADQARAKMKSEATPPPNAPPKKFVKPAAAAAVPSATTAPVRASAAPTAIATARPVQAATARPVQAPAVTPVRTAAPPPPAATPSATTPPHLSPPANTPLASIAPTSTPTASTPQQPTHPLAPPNVHRGTPAPRVSPSAAFASPPQAAETTPPLSSPLPGSTASPTIGDQRRGEKKRQLPRRENPAETSASPSPAP